MMIKSCNIPPFLINNHSSRFSFSSFGDKSVMKQKCIVIMFQKTSQSLDQDDPTEL